MDQKVSEYKQVTSATTQCFEEAARHFPLMMITTKRNITARVVTTSPNVKAMMDSMKDIRTFVARSSRFGPSIAYHNIYNINFCAWQ